MGNLLSLLVTHIGTITTIMKLIEEGIAIAPEIIKGAETQFATLLSFWAEGRDPTDKEMEALIEKRITLEDAILAAQP